MLDLKQLHYFITVAELEHVGKAAEVLFISQSPLSRQISQLEDRLGLILFERKAKRIILTTDGHTFLKEAKALLTHTTRLESLGKRLGKGEEGGLCIGYVNSAMFSNILPSKLRELRKTKPKIHTALYHLKSDKQFEGLIQRSLDIAIVDELLEKHTTIKFSKIYEDPMVLVVADDHHFTKKETITEVDLSEELWLTVKGPYKKGFINECAKKGFSPNILIEVDDPVSALGLVAAGNGITMIQESLKQQLPKNVVTIKLNALNFSITLWVAWHAEILRPIVREFREQLMS